MSFKVYRLDVQASGSHNIMIKTVTQSMAQSRASSLDSRTSDLNTYSCPQRHHTWLAWLACTSRDDRAAETGDLKHTRLSSEDAPRHAALDSFGRKNRRTEEMIFKRATAFSSGDTGGNHKYIHTYLYLVRDRRLPHNTSVSWYERCSQLDCRPTYVHRRRYLPHPSSPLSTESPRTHLGAIVPPVYLLLSLRHAVTT